MAEQAHGRMAAGKEQLEPEDWPIANTTAMAVNDAEDKDNTVEVVVEVVEVVAEVAEVDIDQVEGMVVALAEVQVDQAVDICSVAYSTEDMEAAEEAAEVDNSCAPSTSTGTTTTTNSEFGTRSLLSCM